MHIWYIKVKLVLKLVSYIKNKQKKIFFEEDF